MEKLESRMDSLETKFDDKFDVMEKKLDKVLYAIQGDEFNDGMGKRLGKVEKTIQDDILPWKHFVQKAIVVVATFTTVLALAKYFA